MSAKRNVQRQTLWDEWVKLDASTKKNIELSTNEIFTNIKRAAGDLFGYGAARFSRLGTSDEDVYTRLEELMNVYKCVIRLAQTIHGGGDMMQALIGGICEVLNSRLNEFAVAKQNIIADDGVSCNLENPVMQEKCVIITRTVSYVNKHIEDIGKNFVPWMQMELPEQWKQICSFNSVDVTLEEIIAKECLPEIYIHFQEGLRICLSALDDLHSRKTAGFYTELITREWEELANIIKVQVSVLEAAIAENVDLLDADNLSDVYTILDMLRMVYQQTGPVVESLRKRLNSPPARVAAPTYEEFEAAMVAAINTSETPASSPDANRFLALLNDKVAAIFGQLQGEIPKTASRIKRSVNEQKLLAEAITREFVKLYKALISHKTTPADAPEEKQSHLDILTGIIETIEIKIESLQESIQAITDEGQELLHAFTGQKIMPSEEEQKLAQDTAQTLWFGFPHEKENLAVFFTTLLDNEVFDGFRARVQKHITNYIEKTEKFTFRFKKEVLLYEVCTFEEILMHSVSRLRECEEMAGAVTLLDAAFVKLEMLLKKNNIVAIRPAAHELFNAREHEVMVAEIQDGFAKGEIIKIINTGYKQGDKVILRANVIAAR